MNDASTLEDQRAVGDGQDLLRMLLNDDGGETLFAEEARERIGQAGFARARTGSVGESLPLLVAAAVADVKQMDLGVREPVEEPVWTLDERVKAGG